MADNNVLTQVEIDGKFKTVTGVVPLEGNVDLLALNNILVNVDTGEGIKRAVAVANLVDSGGSSFPAGTVDLFADLPTSTGSGNIYFVENPKTWAKNPRGFYEDSATGWINTNIKVQMSEDAGSVVNWTNWSEWFNGSVDVSIGDKVRYNNLDYINLTGNQTSTAPDTDDVNWKPVNPQGNIIVAKKGGDFATIKEACESITGNTIDNPFFIDVHCGNYEEQPFKVPDFTTLYLNNAKVCPVELGDFIELGNNSAIRKGALSCATDGGATIYVDGSTGAVVDTVRIGDSDGTGYLSRNAGSMTVLNSSCSNIDTAYHADAGILIISTASATNCNIGMRVSNSGFIVGSVFGSFGGVTTDIQQDDATSSMRFINALISVDKIVAVNQELLYITFTSDKVDDEAFHIMQGLSVGVPEQGRESVFGEGDSYTRGMKVYKYDGAAYTDISVAAGSASGSLFSLGNGNVDSAFYVASSLCSCVNDIPLKHSGIKIKVDTSIDDIADISVVEVNPTSPTSPVGAYNQFAQINGEPAYARSDNAYWLFFTQGYWCFNDVQPVGNENFYEMRYFNGALEGTYDPLSTNVGQVSATLSIGNTQNPFVIEYFNGNTSQWENIHYIMKGSSEPYTPYAESIFELEGSFQVWYNLLLAKEFAWSQNDPVGLGENFFWIRIRLVTAITTSPVLEQFKLHCNRSEINEDGFQEFFGSSRYFKALPWDAGLFQAANSSPGNQDLFLSDNVARGYIENEFVNNAIDRVGLNAYLPPELDTSTPIRLVWSIHTNSATAGNIDWKIRWAWTRDGSSIYDSTADAPTAYPNEKIVNYIAPAPLADTQQTYLVDIDVSELIATRPGNFGDVLWITIERTGNSAEDTHGGNVSLINIEPLYASLSLGGHI